ncbi:MAG TPA: DNA repair protein RecO [Gammaproteobacteria bacterium]|nr:DNA repair protein RecO [Gammaproteobacteria bacterium]
MNESTQAAYILHVRSYRESSGLIDYLTHDAGRITLLAKGYKSNTKSRKLFLQPFRKQTISWRGKGELKTLDFAEELGCPVLLEGWSLMSGFYINELMTRLLQPLDPHPELFELYEDTIISLSRFDNLEAILRKFERNILEMMGYGLQLNTSDDGEEIDPEVEYDYLFETGPVRSKGEGYGNMMVSGKTLLSLYRGQFDDRQVLKESKALMRFIIARYIGDRPLKTRELFKYY